MEIQLGDITVTVTLKKIKNVHLSVQPPRGRVTVSAPEHMQPAAIRMLAISKLGWIKRQRQKMLDQERETPREYIDRESHFLWGRRFLLQVIETTTEPTGVELEHRRLVLRVRPGATEEKRREVLESWYRNQLRRIGARFISKWERILGVTVSEFFVQRMKTRWGSCNPASQTIRLNAELAKKPRRCLEYIVLHEMLHLIEPTHNDRFTALLDANLPGWRHRRDELNHLPLGHSNWRH
jgi:predicted metal-dependent hydrolase